MFKDQATDIIQYFRDENYPDDVQMSVEKLIIIIKTFRAHEKLYDRMRERMYKDKDKN